MIVRVVVNIEITDGVDAEEVINDCDYDFKHEHIIATEIVDIEEVE